MFKIIVGIFIGVWLAGLPFEQWLKDNRHVQIVKRVQRFALNDAPDSVAKAKTTLSGAEVANVTEKVADKTEKVADVNEKAADASESSEHDTLLKQKLERAEAELQAIKLQQQRELLAAKLQVLLQQLTEKKEGDDHV